MTFWSKVVLLGSLGFSGFSYAENIQVNRNSTIVAGSVIEVSLSSIRPTQSVIAHDQVNYKLALYRKEPQELFSDLCKNAGWGREVSFDEQSYASQPDSYRCANVGNKRRKTKGLKTVVVGPNNQLYLTDGHHTFSSFYDMPQGGPDMQVTVFVQANFAHLEPDAFWPHMVNKGKAWLHDAQGNSVRHSEMPVNLGRVNLQNDPYRAALYFLRDGVWDKPQPAIEFVEFYWAQYLRKQSELVFPGYHNAAQYLQWLERIHAHFLGLKQDDTIFGDFSAKQLGWLGIADYARLSSLLCNRESNLPTKGVLGTSLTERGMPVQCNNKQYVNRTSLATGLKVLPPALNANNSVNVLIEIAAGSNAKWQQSKSMPLQLEWEMKQGQPRQVQYLSYPANYGIVTGTLLAKENGGDGDPLDVLVLGSALPQGTIVKVRLIGVIRMLDNGEQDDKLLAVPVVGLFSELTDLPQLQADYPGITEQLQHWFEHYKGADSSVTVHKVEDAAAAMTLVTNSML